MVTESDEKPDDRQRSEKKLLKTESADTEAPDSAAIPLRESVIYKGSPRRWWVLLVIVLLQVNAYVIYSTIYPIAIPVSQAFKLSSVSYVNMTIMAQMFNPIPMTFLSIWMYSHFKTNRVLIGVAVIQLLGSAIRASAFFTESFWSLAIGQYVSSCSNAFLLNVQIIIANKWFTDKERGLATALQIVAGPIGSGLSFAMTGTWFKDHNGDDPEGFLRGLISLILCQFGITVIIVVLFLLVIKEKPDTPPSAVAAVIPKALSFSESVTVLRNNSNFCLLMLTYSLPFGSILAVGGLMSNVFDPYGYKASEVSFISLGLLVAGVIGAVSVGAILDRFEKYKLIMTIQLGLFFISGSSVAGSLYLTDSHALIITTIVIGGFIGTGYFPLCFAYSAELTFPDSPALINGMMTMSGSSMSVVIGLLGTFVAADRVSDPTGQELVELKQLRAVLIVCIMPVGGFISFLLNLCIKEDLRRANYDKQELEETPSKVGSDEDQVTIEMEKHIYMVEVRDDNSQTT